MKPPLWTRNFILLCLSNLLLFTAFYALLPTLPIEVVGRLGGRAGQVGLVIGITSFLAVIARPFAGHFFDTLGRRRVVLPVLVGLAAITAGYALLGSVAMLVAWRGVHGLIWGFGAIGSMTMATDVIPGERRGEGIGYFSLSNTVSMAVAPALALWIQGRWGFTPLVLGGALVVLVSCLCVLLVAYPEPRRSGEGGIRWGDLYEGKVLTLCLQVLVMCFGYGGLIALIPLLFRAIGSHSTGLFYTLYALTLLLTRPLVGKIYDRRGPNLLLPAGMVILAASYLLLAIAQGLPWLLASAVVMGVGFSIGQPVIMSMALGRVAPQRRGAVNGNIFTAWDLGIALGAIGLGILAEHAGLRAAFLTCGLLHAVPLILFLVFDRVPATGT